MGRTLGLVAVIAAGLLSTGCIFVGGGSRASTTASRVTPAQVEDMIGRTRGLRVGVGGMALGPTPLRIRFRCTALGEVRARLAPRRIQEHRDCVSLCI